jgi:alpha-galactosidase/6-phospho-beta-glucosidase family protein
LSVLLAASAIGNPISACRHIPVLVDICREMEEVAPDAWLFSYTNPGTCVMMALERVSSIKRRCS